MPAKKRYPEVPVEKLRWRLDPAALAFENTNDLKPLIQCKGLIVPDGTQYRIQIGQTFFIKQFAALIRSAFQRRILAFGPIGGNLYKA